MRGRLSCELDSQRVALEELHNMKDSLTASNRQLDSDLCAASSKIQELHHLHKHKQQDKVCLAQPLLMQMVTYMNWFQETELATCMQRFDREKEFLKNELVEVLCCTMLSNALKLNGQVASDRSEIRAQLEMSQSMYTEAQDECKRTSHLLSQRHWRGAGSVVFAFFRSVWTVTMKSR